MFRSEEVQLIVQLLYMCIFCVLTALCAFSFLNIFTDHKYNENLTHAQTTSTGPASSIPSRWERHKGLESRLRACLTVIKAKTRPGIVLVIYLTNVVVYVLIIVLSAYTRPDNRFQKHSSNRSDKRTFWSDTRFIHVNYIAKMLADLAFHNYVLIGLGPVTIIDTKHN